MKILFVSDLYNIDNNNDSKALNNFVSEWQRSGHEVFVIRPNFLFNTLLRGKKISKEKLFEENGVKVLNLNFLTPFWGNIWKKIPYDFSDFDVLISHMPSGALFSLRLKEKLNIKHCISVHISDIEVLTNPLYSIYFKNKLLSAYKQADYISPRSFCLKNKIEKIIGENKNIFIAPSGVKSEYIIERKNIEKPQKLIITTVANLIKRKNIDVVLKALSKIKEFDFEYRIIGDGKERKKLQKLAEKLKINDKVKFIGKLPHEIVLENLRQSHVFVMISQNETFGLAYLEAMASGNIVICAKDEGIDGILKNSENGFLCDINSDSLKDLLIEVYNLKFDEISKILENTRNTAFENTEEIASQNYFKNLFN